MAARLPEPQQRRSQPLECAVRRAARVALCEGGPRAHLDRRLLLAVEVLLDGREAQRVDQLRLRRQPDLRAHRALGVAPHVTVAELQQQCVRGGSLGRPAAAVVRAWLWRQLVVCGVAGLVGCCLSDRRRSEHRQRPGPAGAAMLDVAVVDAVAFLLLDRALRVVVLCRHDGALFVVVLCRHQSRGSARLLSHRQPRHGARVLCRRRSRLRFGALLRQPSHRQPEGERALGAGDIQPRRLAGRLDGRRRHAEPVPGALTEGRVAHLCCRQTCAPSSRRDVSPADTRQAREHAGEARLLLGGLLPHQRCLDGVHPPRLLGPRLHTQKRQEPMQVRQLATAEWCA
eukprot:scaffold9692_cov96-Isochrysis_galbana.AAC.3